MRVVAAVALVGVVTCVATLLATARAAGREAEPNAVIDEYCASCHSRTGKAGGVVLDGFDLTSPLVSSERLERMIRKVRAGQMPPAGAERPAPAVLTALADALEARADAKAASLPRPTRMMPRLNRAEYALAVEDLTGLRIDVQALLPPDTLSDGFDNIADVQTASPALVGAYLRSASKIATDVVQARPAVVFICRPGVTASGASCTTRLIDRLVDRAYRGQADEADRADATAAFARGRAVGTIDDGLRSALQSVLMSPKFLFRPEPTSSDGTVTDIALASRLSFFLWSRGPDDALIAQARAGRLHTPAQLTAAARRMLAAPEARTLATRFAAQWLRLQDLDKTAVDAVLRRDMRSETELFVRDVVARDRRVLDLITAGDSFVNARLAAAYGLTGVTGDAFRRVALPPERRGVLGQASVLTLTSVGNRTSPVLRGKWILDVLLGTPPPPPPPNVPALDDSVPAGANGAARSTRQRVEAHRANPQCASCHRLIDPPGLTLEGFDQIGRYRTTDNGVAIDATAPLYDGQVMDGPDGLRAAVLNHRDVVLRHFTARLMTYALGRRLVDRDAPAVRAIVREAGRAGERFSAFVTGIVTSEAFRQ